MKRLIFVLLYRDGSYMLSRNFRLQRVGDLDWVLRNYELRRVSLGIDELVVLDVSDHRSERERFHAEVTTLTEQCFVPVAVGGGIRDVDEVGRLLAIGADKVVLNAPFFTDRHLCEAIASRYGSQALVAGIDVARDLSSSTGGPGRPIVTPETLVDHVRMTEDLGAGELLVQSVDRDGTGNGLDLAFADMLGGVGRPVIMLGGVGQADHIVEGLLHPAVDAVATANLFNFVGDSLVTARSRCVERGVRLPTWDHRDFDELTDHLLKTGSS